MIDLALVWTITIQIVIRFGIIGGGIAIILGYICWAANRFEDSLTKFIIVGMGPFLFIAIVFGVLAEQGVIK